MKVGFFQFQPIFGEPEKNLETIKTEAARAGHLDLLVLPELCTTGYQFISQKELAELAEPAEDSPSIRGFKRLASEIGGIVVAGFAEAADGTYYNSAAVVGADGLIAIYRKIHLFFEEKDFFAPGNLPISAVKIGSVKIGVLICFDWIFPEAARILALQGAAILCLPANLVLPYCQQAMRIRALENRIYTIVANRFGTEARPGKKALTFTGQSQITGVDGTPLVTAPVQEQQLGVIDIDPQAALDKWITPKNHIFSDRRPELYQPLIAPNE